jgi:hypothetical protein
MLHKVKRLEGFYFLEKYFFFHRTGCKKAKGEGRCRGWEGTQGPPRQFQSNPPARFFRRSHLTGMLGFVHGADCLWFFKQIVKNKQGINYFFFFVKRIFLKSSVFWPKVWGEIWKRMSLALLPKANAEISL